MSRANREESARDLSRLVAVAVPVPSLDLLTYRVPADIELPAVGARVLVPLGARQVTGVVVAVEAEMAGLARTLPPPEEIKDVADVLDGTPFLPASVIRLALWTAEYYACGPGDALAAAMPPLAWVASDCVVRLTDAGAARLGASGSRARETLAEKALRMIARGKWISVRTLALQLQAERARGGARIPARGLVHALEREGLVKTETVLKGRRWAFRTMRVVEATEAGRQEVPPRPGPQPPAVSAYEALGPKQRKALEILASSAEPVAVTSLRARGISSATIDRLRDRGLAAVRSRTVERDPFAHLDRVAPRGEPASSDRRLTAEQTVALGRLTRLAGDRVFRVALVHGVTGSGKTEIYLRLAAVVRDQGRSALVLVPEIALTPALASAFRGVFGSRVAVQHSGLSAGERHDQWQRIRNGEIDVVVGTRSAVFAPLASPGLIIVDEEHDTSYKQEESPRYHGRDLAVVRGRQANALVVLGSATPSLESYWNAREGRYELLTLERRILDRPLASVRIVNMRDEFAARGPDVIVSALLAEAIADRLARGEQVLILLNRRGFATSMFCRQCGATLECPNCSVSLTVHQGRSGPAHARCHYCNYGRPAPPACLQCAGPYLVYTGFGTERVEAELRGLFAGARVARLDRDTARGRGASATVLGRVGRGEIDVLIGTQMIAKGHDFPRVTLVGVVSADVGLGLADFRAAERTFQLLTQVVGRAGRGERPGEAIIQTLVPEHYSIQHACRQDYPSFFTDELRYRRAMRYPPAVGLINVVVKGPTLGDAMRAAGDLARHTRDRLPHRREFEVLGPAPAPFVKLRGESRAQFFLKGPRRLRLRAALDEALAMRPDVRRRVLVDVDPMSVL